MQTTTDTTRSTEARAHDLDSLAALDCDALAAIYARGTVRGVGPLEGRPTGRMLAWKAISTGPSSRARLRARLGDALRRFSASKGFPWGGKSFAGSGDSGSGVNRVHLGGRHQLFPFLTRVAPSVVDGKPCVVLNYDLEDNPGFIRAIHDEVREVAPGLYLGPAMWKSASGPKLVLWFALDTRLQAAPIGAA